MNDAGADNEISNISSEPHDDSSVEEITPAGDDLEATTSVDNLNDQAHGNVSDVQDSIDVPNTAGVKAGQDAVKDTAQFVAPEPKNHGKDVQDRSNGGEDGVNHTGDYGDTAKDRRNDSKDHGDNDHPTDAEDHGNTNQGNQDHGDGSESAKIPWNMAEVAGI